MEFVDCRRFLFALFVAFFAPVFVAGWVKGKANLELAGLKCLDFEMFG